MRSPASARGWAEVGRRRDGARVDAGRVVAGELELAGEVAGRRSRSRSRWGREETGRTRGQGGADGVEARGAKMGGGVPATVNLRGSGGTLVIMFASALLFLFSVGLRLGRFTMR